MPVKPRVGYAGLGIMGSRMARRILDAGYPLTIWNRSRGRSASLAQRGAVVAEDPRALASSADVICLCLADPAALLSTLEAMVSGLRSGQRVVDFSTIGPDAARQAARLCQDAGASYVEAPVTGSKGGAADGTLLLMAGGDEAVVDEMRPLLAEVSKQVIYCGPHGSASIVKLVGNSLITHMLIGIAQGLAVARETGVAGEKVLEVVQASGFASPYYSFKGKQMLARDFDTHFSLDLLYKDLVLLLGVAGPRRIPLGGVSAMATLVQSARARGWGGEDIAAVSKLFEVTSPSAA